MQYALAVALVAAQAWVLVRLCWPGASVRLPMFVLYLALVTIPYHAAPLFGAQLHGWHVWPFLALTLLVGAEAARLNWTRRTADSLLVLAAVAMFAFAATPDGAIATLTGTEGLLPAYVVQGVANALGLVLALFPACVALIERRAWDWRIGHALGAAAWFGVTLWALAAWRDAPVPAVLVDGAWRDNQEYWVRMRWVFAGESVGHMVCVGLWLKVMR